MTAALVFLIAAALGALLNAALPAGDKIDDVRYVNGERVVLPCLETWGPRRQRFWGTWYRRVEGDPLFDTEAFARGPRPFTLRVVKRPDGTREVVEASAWSFAFSAAQSYETVLALAAKSFGRDIREGR